MSKKLSELSEIEQIGTGDIIYIVKKNEDGTYSDYKLTYEKLLNTLNIPSESYIKGLIDNRIVAHDTNNLIVDQYLIGGNDDTMEISITAPSTILMQGKVDKWYNLNTGLQAYNNGVLINTLNFGVQSGAISDQKIFSGKATVNDGDNIYIRPSYNANSYFYNPAYNKGVAQAIIVNTTDPNITSKIVMSSISLYLNSPTAASRTTNGYYKVTQNCVLYVGITSLKTNTQQSLYKNAETTSLKSFYPPKAYKKQYCSFECAKDDIITYDFGYKYGNNNDCYSQIVFCEVPKL